MDGWIHVCAAERQSPLPVPPFLPPSLSFPAELQPPVVAAEDQLYGRLLSSSSSRDNDNVPSAQFAPLAVYGFLQQQQPTYVRRCTCVMLHVCVRFFLLLIYVRAALLLLLVWIITRTQCTCVNKRCVPVSVICLTYVHVLCALYCGRPVGFPPFAPVLVVVVVVVAGTSPN